MKRRIALFLFLILFFYILNAFINPYPKKNTVFGFKPKYGVSYSFEQVSWYGLDTRKTYLRLIDDINFDWIRLPVFWDMNLDYKDGKWQFNSNFEDIEFAVSEAEKRNKKVVIALGAKTPYYPEYHLPDEIKNQLKFGDKINVSHPVADDILVFDRMVVTRLSRFDNIIYWQVENEPFLGNINNWKIESDLLEKEVDVVRRNDIHNRPILLSHVGPAVFDRKWKQLLPFLKKDDAIGFNAYFKTQGVSLFSFELFGKVLTIPWPNKLVWPVQSWIGFSPNFENLRKSLGNNGLNMWVLEMQAEPYVRNKEYASGSQFFFKADDIISADNFLKASRVENVGFWGAPFWYFRESLGDSSYLEAVSGIVN